MHKKDFELIASIIATLPVTDEVRLVTASHFANILSCTNPRFDAMRFLTASRGSGKEQEPQAGG